MTTQARDFTATATEFPDYPLNELPAIPASWDERAWRNDACPSFQTPTSMLVWVDYPKAEDREFPELKRFVAYHCDETGANTDDTPAIETEDWNALLAAVLGHTFIRVLRDWLSPAQFAEMQDANAADAPGSTCCASHDFCDANMAMEEAFTLALGREPVIEDDENGAESPDVALWNAAWNAAAPIIRTVTDTFDVLAAEFAAYTKEQALPEGDATELLMFPALTGDQRAWLEGFVTRWDATEERDPEHNTWSTAPAQPDAA